MNIFILVILVGLIIYLSYLLFQKQKELKKYLPLIDLENEIKNKKKDLEDTTQQLKDMESNLFKLTEEVKILTDDHDLLSAGFYKPRYDFAESKIYAERLDEIRYKQKALIKEKNAIKSNLEWTVSGSKSEGKKMIDRIIKLGLSAFNVQSDNEILSVKFDNIDRSEKKLNKIRENVDKLLEPNKCNITEEFFKLKLEELYLAYEYREKIQKEKAEQRILREQAREEERALREAEKARVTAEQEENLYQEALTKAKADLESKSDEERELWKARIADLEVKLKEAHEIKERAKSLAEQTRRGNVYIISNIGSFGENIYKIGMTRRLDPLDRIWELSDASVPFDFDVHALIQTDDAPTLERQLHQEFIDRQVNRVNERKEFFKVSLDEISNACKKFHHGEFKLTLLAEAKEFRQSIALLKAEEKKSA